MRGAGLPIGIVGPSPTGGGGGRRPRPEGGVAKPSDPPAVAARPPSWAASGRVPSLDGLRAVSILLVLWCHVAPTWGIAGRSVLGKVASEAEIGVDVFFAISGFLITLLLLRESDRHGSISLRGFFARRALRLLPAFAAYLLYVAALARAGIVEAAAVDWVAASTYTINTLSVFGHQTTWALGHLWSLAVEE